MRIKKLTGRLAVLVLAIAALTTAALACGGHRGGHHAAAPVSCALCPFEDCETAGRHDHDGTTYCGYAHTGGVCDGTCAALCPVEGCEIAGRHVHDGVTYCGSNHDCGWCDGSCPVYSGACCGGHHGCRR